MNCKDVAEMREKAAQERQFFIRVVPNSFLPESIYLVCVGPARRRCAPRPSQLRERRGPGHHGGPGQADAGARATTAHRVCGGGGRVQVITPATPQSES
jgi:hypothetical protein